MPNRLAAESSPYLQQHAANPVDWYAWGADAFAAAAAADKPILLSIGYAACHWCHVMAHESFEDETTARLMNELFVNVKVDREERPDIDSIYMQAVQAITGRGGWPMTMFLTPEGAPFFGGTYFPPEDRHGLPSFRRILVSVSEAWRTQRDEVLKGATTLRRIYAAGEEPPQAGTFLTPTQLSAALRALRTYHDAHHGGFGGAPKFPQPMLLDAMLRHWARSGEEEWLRLVRFSFTKMAEGGLYDQLGGGFHRYCVDAIWLVPHFEKMLYDNALLARLAVRLWQAIGDPLARRVAEETFAWTRREMTDPSGGWYSSLDADSEGEEGRFYVWTIDEFRRILGAGAAEAERAWGVRPEGNFEGANILHGAGSFADPASLGEARRKLLAVRAQRVRPSRDEKVVASWNGLMLRAMAEGARAFDDPELRDSAVRGGEFLSNALLRGDRTLRTWRDGRATVPGFLEDHAALGLGFLALHELTFDRRWLDLALALAATCVREFWDDETGAFFDTARDAERLVTRPRDVTDNAIPSGTSLAVELQLLVAEHTGDVGVRQRAERVLATLAQPLRRAPMAFGHLLGVADLAVHGAVQLTLSGDHSSAAWNALAAAAATECVPALVIRSGNADASGVARAIVCRGQQCDLPTSDPAQLRDQLRAARSHQA